MVMVILNVLLRALSMLLMSERRSLILPFDVGYDSPETNIISHRRILKTAGDALSQKLQLLVAF
jgi:hypothetical protein